VNSTSHSGIQNFVGSDHQLRERRWPHRYTSGGRSLDISSTEQCAAFVRQIRNIEGNRPTVFHEHKDLRLRIWSCRGNHLAVGAGLDISIQVGSEGAPSHKRLQICIVCAMPVKAGSIAKHHSDQHKTTYDRERQKFQVTLGTVVV
jgi:hypothetical protein